MKRFFPILLAFAASLNANPTPASAKEVNYEWLAEHMGPSIKTMKKVFDVAKPKVALEFGVGLTTKFFLDSCTKAISVEFVTNGCGPDAIRKYISFYQGLSNWIPISYFSGWPGDMNWAPYRYLGSDKVYKAASYGNATGKSYAEVDNLYQVELKVFLTNLSKSNRIEIAFVNTVAAYPIRGDIIQILFGKAPLILAFDCSRSSNAADGYGYSRVKTPEDYEEIYFPNSGGATLWIQKNEKYAPMAEELRAYAETL
jgi:hypothetical protein